MKDFFGDIDVILISNSYWINDRQPCLTYGLRGVVHATIEVSGAPQDLHSGVDGGAYDEPLDNLLKVLGRLSSDSKQVLVPGFADCVRPVDKDEMAAYELLTSRLQK